MKKIENYVTVVNGAKIIDMKSLQNDFGLNLDEALFLSRLDHLPKQTSLLNKFNQQTMLDPLELAPYEYANGVEMWKKLIGPVPAEDNKKAEMAKAIFRKICPKKFNFFF